MAVCTATGKCAIRDRTDGATCGDGRECQGGACVTGRTVGLSFDSFDEYHTHCYVTVDVAGFAQGTHPGSVSSQEFTIEVGADGTGRWTSASINLIWMAGDTVTARVDGVSSGAVPVTC